MLNSNAANEVRASKRQRMKAVRLDWVIIREGPHNERAPQRGLISLRNTGGERI